MIIRIVKMTFQENKTSEFQELFGKYKEKIRASEGVQQLELYRDVNQKNIFFTYSIWDNASHLEAYRRSELFKTVWTKTRSLFSEKAEAWSVDKMVSL